MSDVAVASSVARVAPSTSISEVGAKSEPVTVTLSAGPPAVTAAGESDTNFGGGGGATIFRGIGDDASPDGVTTVTWRAPAFAILLAVIQAAIFVAEKNTVVCSTSSSRAIDPAMNAEPLMVSQNAPSPAMTVEGERLDSVGASWPRSSKSAAMSIDRKIMNQL
ncbi:MAG TPA: hypothetical protein VEA16_04420 [Vicinamibacterales bacterium]|nr:hypothetical protein [Vicinamibacterales bacterium]